MRRLADRISRIRAEKEAEAIASYEEAVRRQAMTVLEAVDFDLAFRDGAGRHRGDNPEVKGEQGMAAAEVYVKSRDKRIKASEHEVADKTALIAAMQKAKLSVYKDEDHGLVITITPGKPNVKVQEANDDDEAGEEEAA